MSDQENPDGSPRPKRSRLSRPFQVLSLPANSRGRKNAKNTLTQPQLPQVVLEDVGNDFENSIAGVIKKLQLTNFMCHGNFEIEFNPRINFISGANGSGKSAIQTAIAIGLGGVASKTNRSSKIEGLIKHGCHSGSITITLTNTGLNAYKPQEYGNQIKIVRTITASSSTYRLYNQWDKLVSNKKAELDLITFKFKIQPNNPVSILNQDMARNFLSSNKAESKYAMFRKAILLDEAEAMLNSINLQIMEQRERIAEKEKTEEILDKEIEAMNQKMQLVEDLKEAKERREQLKNEYLWCEVHACREELMRLEGICDDHENAKSELVKEVDKIRNEIIDIEEKIKKLEQTLVSLQNESRTKEETIQRCRQEFRNKRDCYHSKCEEYEKISTTIKHKRVDKDQIQASLDDIEREENEQISKKEEARVRIVRYQNDLRENESKVRVLQQEISRLGKTTLELQEMKKEKERRVYGLTEEIRANERQIGSLESSDNLSVYSNWMPTLVKRIEDAVQRGKFSKPPKGPLGRYIQVKHDQWTNAIESYLNTGLLSSFFVNNTADRNELYKIMDQVINGQKPTVHCSQFQDRDRKSMLPRIEAKHGSYLNIYRALKISDPVVANFLMDMKHIHQVLLVEDTVVCRKIMSSGNWVQNCTAIINRNADSYHEGCRYYANMRPSRARLLQKNVAHHIESLKEEIEEKKHTIAKEKSDLSSLTEQHRSSQAKIEQLHSEMRKYGDELSRAKRSISELENIINMEMPSLQTKFEELNSLEQELVQLEERKKKAREEQNRLAEEMNQAKKLLEKCGVGDTAFQQSQLSQDIEKAKSDIEVRKRRILGYEKKISELDIKIQHSKGRIEDFRKKTEEKCSQVSEYSEASQSQEPREEDRRALRDVKEDLDQLIAFIEEAEKKVGTECISFEKEFITKQMSQRKFKKMFTELKKMHNKYKEMSKERKATISEVRDMSTNVVRVQFAKVIQSRNYNGQLQFDHTKGRLDILLAPPDSGNAYMNSESLSGGEKSVSTVAFLMALWSNMDLPFYSMDEYDVFMDAINRRTITGLLTSFACDKSSRQFIFLTPLDVSLIQTGPNVTVHRVKKIM